MGSSCLWCGLRIGSWFRKAMAILGLWLGQSGFFGDMFGYMGVICVLVLNLSQRLDKCLCTTDMKIDLKFQGLLECGWINVTIKNLPWAGTSIIWMSSDSVLWVNWVIIFIVKIIWYLDILGSIPTRGSLGFSDTWFWWVWSCIHGLILKDGSKGPCFGEVPRDLKKKFIVKINVRKRIVSVWNIYIYIYIWISGWF